jgi:hypothetical protein
MKRSVMFTCCALLVLALAPFAQAPPGRLPREGRDLWPCRRTETLPRMDPEPVLLNRGDIRPRVGL